MCKGFVPGSDKKLHILVLFWILSIYCTTVRSKERCYSHRADIDSNNRIVTCGQNPTPPKKIVDPAQCKTTCKYRYLPRRTSQRMGLEYDPELLQYPENPRFVDDTRFCLVFHAIIFLLDQDVTYNVQMGSYRCTLNIWMTNGRNGSDVKKVDSRDFAARFGLQLYSNTLVRITTTYQRMSKTSWEFRISGKGQKFNSEVESEMQKCLEALEIEGTVKGPQDATTYTKHCIEQNFALNYPTECTSLKFDGGWKRGQTVTSSIWTIQFVNNDKDHSCMDIGSAKTYDVVREFTDRHITIRERQLRAGMNRICNEFFFTATFGKEPKTKDYGPYTFKICGFILVSTTPCIVLEPHADASDVIRLPYGQPFTLDARETMNQGQGELGGELFEWTCKVKGTNKPCLDKSQHDFKLVYVAPKALMGSTLEVTLTFTHFIGTPQKSNASESRYFTVVSPHDLFITIRCLSNCNPRSVSVKPVVLIAECEWECENLQQFTYLWNITEVTKSARGRLIVGKELKELVEGAAVNKQVFSVTDAGNVLLDRVFTICVLVVRKKGDGDACHRLNYKGAPIPSKGDCCIVSPFSAELPGFLEYTYSGLCNWRSGNNSLKYKLFTYDVGVPEDERQLELVAFSDISRMPKLELPFGNPKHDYELGLIFHVSNAEGLTYVYNVNEAFQKIGVTSFKVRKPVDYAFLNKIEIITNNLLDEKKSNQFGSRQGLMHVAGLVANVLDQGTESHASGLGVEKRALLRKNLLSSLAPLANSDVDTVLQLTPIMDKLTTEVSDEVEERGADVLAPLTAGLRSIVTDYKTTDRLSRTQYAVLERMSTRNVIRQTDALTQNVSRKAKNKFVDRANQYSQMFLNVGTGLVSSSLIENSPRVEVMPNSAIAVNWVRIRNDSVLSVNKSRTNTSTFGSIVSVSAASLNLTAGQSVNVIMTINKRNLFVFGNGTNKLNMPMINMEIQYRGQNKPVAALSLSEPANIFLERTFPPGRLKRLIWERVNVTRAEDPNALRTDFDPTTSVFRHLLLPWATRTIPASDTYARLLKFKKSENATFTFLISVDLVSHNGSRLKSVFDRVHYPQRAPMRTLMGATQRPDILFLPTVDSMDPNTSYVLNFTISWGDQKKPDFSEADSPYLQMLLANVSCQTWDPTNATWQSSGCEATDLSTLEVLHCQCSHFSIFSGSLLVPANPINVLEFKLFKEFFKNPAIVSVVVFIWLVYFILIYWARQEDWLDTFRSRVAVLEDNKLRDKRAYLVCCVTGWWINSGTTARVFIYIKGTRGMSRVHRLKDDEQDLFGKGAENWFVLTSPSSLGTIKSVVVWHDSSGESPAWFLKEIFVQDINKGHIWHCMYNDWLSVEHGDGELCVEVPALTSEEVHSKRLYQIVLKTSLNFRQSHIWIGIALKPPYSPFTRVQRLTCALCLLMTTMLSSLMFYGIPSNDPEDQVSKGPLRLDLHSMVIGIECALVVFPINVLLVQLFSRTSSKPTTRKYPIYTFDERKLVALDAATGTHDAKKSDREETHGSFSMSLTSSHAEHFKSPEKEHSQHPEDKPHHHHHRHGHTLHKNVEGVVEDEESSSYSVSSSSSDSGGQQSSAFGILDVFSHGQKSVAQSSTFISGSSTTSVVHSKELSSSTDQPTSSTYSVLGTGPTAEFQDINFQPSATDNRLDLSASTDFHTSSNLESKSQQSVTSLGDVSRSQSVHIAPDKDSNISACTDGAGHNVPCLHTGDTFDPNNLASSQSLHSPNTNTQHHAPIDDIQFDSLVRLLDLDTNNSAMKPDTDSKSYQSSSRARYQPSRRISSQFTSITETQWFQSAVRYLRNNISRMLQENTEANQEYKRSNPVPVNVGDHPSNTETGKGSAHRGSYFDKLKEKVKNRPDRDTGKTFATFYAGGGDWKEQLVEDSRAEDLIDSDWEEGLIESDWDDQSEEEDQPKPSYFDKLKTKRTCLTQPCLDDKTLNQQAPPQKPPSVENTSETPSPKACWFCNTIPGQEQAMRHLRALKKRPKPSSGGSSSNTDRPSSGLKTIKDKLKRANSKLKGKKATQDKQSETSSAEEEPEKLIPFESILLEHDYHYQQAVKEGPRALRAFKRQAAQCIAEDILNTNRNAVSEDDGSPTDYPESHSDLKTHPAVTTDAETHEESESESHTVGPVSKRPGCCKFCLRACVHSLVATFLCLFICQCPRGCKVPWWTVYFTWTLAILVALSSSWVVMLYGLRLDYQTSVDWLSSFFTGWFQNAVMLQPIKVVIASLVYICVLGQHVNVREEAQIDVLDENNDPLYKAILRDMEARKRVLGGMWTTTDYSYPVPRSKAKDIRLRLEQDAKARLILRESLIWAVYLTTVTIAALGHMRVEDAHATNSILRTMLEEGTVGDFSLEDISIADDVWEYATVSFLPFLYADSNKTTANNVSLVMGTIRFRQIRQTTERDLCTGFMDNRFIKMMRKKHCLPTFGLHLEEQRNFDQKWSKPFDDDAEDIFQNVEVDSEDYRVAQAWQFRSASKLDETILWGQRAFYPGGGYTVDLPGTLEESQKILKRLNASRWLDRDTRALVMVVNLYTPSKDLITVATLLCEWTQEGSIVTRLDLHTSTLHWYANDQDSYTSLAEVCWIVMITVNIYNEMRDLIMIGVVEYLQSPWSYLELVNFYLSLATIGAQMARVVLADIFKDRIVKAEFDAYVSFAVPRFLDELLVVLKSLVFMLVLLKVFRVLRFNRYFRILLQTFYIARFSILNQSMITVVLFMAFGIAGIVLFGFSLEEYSSLGATIFSLLSIGLGEGDFYGMQEAQPVLSPILFFLFVISFTILSISFFVTFVIESFNVSRVFVQLNAEEQHVVKYVIRLWRLLIGHPPKIRNVRRQRRTHPFKQASFVPRAPNLPD